MMVFRTAAALTLLLGTTCTALACGTERWPVKTGTDDDAASVDLAPQDASVATLIQIQPPQHPKSKDSTRFAPTELQVFTVQGTVTLVRLEDDQDYHIVLKDGPRTMIVESSNPSCATGSVFEQKIAAVREKLDQQLGGPLLHISEKVRPGWNVTVTGVAFFDVKHGQTGVALNAIELHPLLDITFQ
jgi:hypothetical protein